MLLQRFFDRYLFLLVHMKGLLTHGFRRASYSQFGEDLVLAGLLKGRHGFFVDVGAFHPMHYSNTYFLYRRGWRGLNIEPNPRAKVLFRLHRPSDTHVVSGVASSESKKQYYIFNHQSCNTFSEAHRDLMLARPFMRLVETVAVPVSPLTGILDAHARDQKIDFLNVDVEGMNLEVLETLDFVRYTPRIICVEDDDFDFSAPNKSFVHAFLTEKGYLLRSRVGLSSIYEIV